MRRRPSTPTGAVVTPGDADWTVTVTEPLPDCPSVEAAWERLATQTRWQEWRSQSKMRGRGVTTAVVPPAIEPLMRGDEYVVRVGRLLKIRCRVVESSSPDSAGERDEEMVFDATGVTLGGMVKARFRFTIFKTEDGIVTARADEKLTKLPFLSPSKTTLESEHRHTLKELNRSFVSPPPSS